MQETIALLSMVLLSAFRLHKLICPALPVDAVSRRQLHHAGDTIRMRAPSRREWLPFNGSQIRLLETEEFREPSELPKIDHPRLESGAPESKIRQIHK